MHGRPGGIFLQRSDEVEYALWLIGDAADSNAASDAGVGFQRKQFDTGLCRKTQAIQHVGPWIAHLGKNGVERGGGGGRGSRLPYRGFAGQAMGSLDDAVALYKQRVTPP
ncbi:hypothetical protein WT77_26825 [Burkholderia stagnalis]|nr:hypothetical protein WT18_09750 [Burkholderia stagnalis]KVP13093.1 hypothetical protein WT20_11465 [Burkholderia stagnalis]KVW96606.1 hypothetical protein WT30_12520 [Burkholderia stagnalis]KWH75728.1 hypothetical protein WT66_02750 [Burkholderia stagnalis]KWK19079.1 hypothetical protein WT77_26825 [Burkholderia stagnalis]